MAKIGHTHVAALSHQCGRCGAVHTCDADFADTQIVHTSFCVVIGNKDFEVRECK